MTAVRNALVAAALVAVCVAVLPAGVAGAQDRPRDNAVGASIRWAPCDPPSQGLQCARIQVPLDWDRPWGRTISLALVRHPASRPEERIGSLFVNFGGPGVAGVSTVKATGRSLDRLGRGRFDIIGWDPRGTGESTHISCFADQKEEAKFWGPFSAPITAAEWTRRMPQAVAFAKRCTKRNRDLLRYASTADTVRDLDYLREALGEPQLNYRGISYGTFIGQTYANLFPDKVRAMILDGNIDPFAYTRSVVAAMGNGDADQVIEKFLQLCAKAGPRRCALAKGGSPQKRFSRLVAQLKREPIPAPKADPPELTYSDLLVNIFIKQVDPVGWPDWAAELDEAARGDGSRIARQIQATGGLLESSLNSAVGLQCADKPVPPKLGPSAWPRVLGTLTKGNTFNGPFLAWLLWAPCSAWTVPAVHRYTGPWDAVTPNPVLVIGTRYDPRTPYRSSVLVSKTLGNAVLLTHEGYGHTTDPDPSACIARDVAEYLIRLATPPPGTVCQSDRLPFDAQVRLSNPSAHRGKARFP